MSGPWPLLLPDVAAKSSRRTRRSSPPDPCNKTTTSVHAVLPLVATNRPPTGCPLHSTMTASLFDDEMAERDRMKNRNSYDRPLIVGTS
jgi:hypothetical protein